MGRDGYTGLVVVAASLALLAGTMGLERHPMVPVGPGFYPRIVLSITALMALALFVADIVRHRRAPGTDVVLTASRYGLVTAAFAVFAVYVLTLPFVGFRVGTFVFVAALQALLDPPRGLRRWVILLAVAAITSAATYFVFERYLHVLLPRGRWTGF